MMDIFQYIKDKLNRLNANNAIIVVSGLPRSGTSMMMQMLVAGGVEAVTDGKRGKDKHNVNGYLELEAVKTLYKFPLTGLETGNGKVIKVVSPLLKFLPLNYQYKVIFMDRDITEVVRSQNAMIEDNEHLPKGVDNEIMETKLTASVDAALLHIRSCDCMEVLVMNHAETLDAPLEGANKIARFLGRGLNIGAMEAAVDKKLYRQRNGSKN